MKILKVVLGFIVGIMAFVLIVALFVRKDYAVEREITINKPKKEVFDYIKLVRNSDYYSKWVMMDPGMKKEYTGVDGTVGFEYAWDSENKNVGKGEQEIKSVIEGERIDFGLHFIRPFEGLANAYMKTASVSDNETKVKWGFDSKMPYPMNLMLLFMNMENMLGKDIEIGLINLKQVLEKN